MRFATAVHAIAAEASGVLVVVDMRSGACLRLNATGARIWRGLEGGLAADQIARELAAHFRIDERVAAADVAAFLDSLRARDLLAP